MMTRLLIAACCIWVGQVAVAYETAGLRSLQKGPAGRGEAFIDSKDGGYEAVIHAVRQNGRVSSDRVRMSGSIGTNALQLARGSLINDNLYFSLFLERHDQDTTYESNTGNHLYQSDSGRLEIGAGPRLQIGELVFGGSVSANFLDEENVTVETAGVGSQYTLPSAVVPSMRLFAGLDFGLTQCAMGLKLPGKKTVDRRSTSPGTVEEVEVERSVASEAGFDCRVLATDAIRLGFDVTQVTPAEAGVHMDEKPGDRGENPSDSYMKAGFGGVYQAAPSMSLHSSVQYTQPSFRKKDYRSPMLGNLGGAEIRVGSALTGDFYRLFYDVGYVIPHKVSQAASGQAPHPWALPGEKIAMQEEKWIISVGGSIVAF